MDRFRHVFKHLMVQPKKRRLAISRKLDSLPAKVTTAEMIGHGEQFRRG